MACNPLQPFGDGHEEIRLVRVTGRDENGYIKCSMRHTILGEVEYTALSHVWGSNNATYLIAVEQAYLWIRPNLYHFLEHACEELREVDLWIDALCINQDDILEKNRQIPLMGQIFSRARKVIA